MIGLLRVMFFPLFGEGQGAAPPRSGDGRIARVGLLAGVPSASVRRRELCAILPEAPVEATATNLEAAVAAGQALAALGQLHLERLRGAGGEVVARAAELEDDLQPGELDALGGAQLRASRCSCRARSPGSVTLIDALPLLTFTVPPLIVTGARRGVDWADDRRG